jgi:xanthine dehydrogenase YagT iron-sulfur-binding subunit
MDGKRVTSCLTLAVMHEGADIVTIDGLATNGRLHPLQQAFIDEDAFQCGYSRPGRSSPASDASVRDMRARRPRSGNE